MSAPNVQISCDSCTAKYNFGLPSAIVQRPDKAMLFRCSACGYRFQIQPEDILNQDAVAETVVLVKSNKLFVHHNLQEVVDKIEEGIYVDTDIVRIFGTSWQMLEEAKEFASLFGPVESEEVETEIDEASVEDVSFDTSDFLEEDDEDLSQEMSEIDPFSESIADLASEFENEEFEDDIQIDWGDSSEMEEESTIKEEEVIFEEPKLEEPRFEEPKLEEARFEEPKLEDPRFEEPKLEEPKFEEPRFEDIEQSVEEDISLDSEWFDAEDDDEQNVSVPPNSIEDIEANLWDELDLTDDEDEQFVEHEPEPKTEQSSTNSPSSFSDLKKGLLSSSTVSEDASQKDFPIIDGYEPDSISEEAIVNAQAEIQETDGDESEEPEEPEVPAAKSRLSFSNPTPTVPKSEKKELNPSYVIAFVVIFVVALAGYTFRSSEPTPREYKGLETNSDKLKSTDESKTALRESDKDNPDAAEKTEDIDADADASTDGKKENENTEANSGDTSEEDALSEEVLEVPFPSVLPDVQAESIDYANDKTPLELTRKGFQALGKKDPDLAKRYFELALKKDNEYSEANFGLGQAYKARGEEDLAVVHMCKGAVRDVAYRLNTVFQMGRDCP